jgi:carboxymethylenebutenolidase
MQTLLFCLSALALLSPTAQDPARARLEASPRHHEWLDVKSGERSVRAFAAFPEKAAKVPVVLVIHENKGLTDWVRSVCDRLAEEGFVAVAPDLLSGAGPEGGDTASFASSDDATKALYAREAAEVAADLDAVVSAALALDASDGTLFVAGFCWGGTQTFAFATRSAKPKSVFVFYGSSHKEAELLAQIECPVYGFYAENDARINGGIAAAQEALKTAGKLYEPEIYPGAGHGFMRAGEAADASEGNRTAREAAWKRWLGHMR